MEMEIQTLRERVHSYIRNNDADEAIVLIEDELDDIVARIFSKKGYSDKTIMSSDGRIACKLKNGYLLFSDEGQKMFLSEEQFKGRYNGPDSRVQIGKTRTKKNGQVVCYDAMECMSHQELKYQLFEAIEDRDIRIATSMARAICRDADLSDQEEIKFCIQKLRDLVRNQEQLRLAS